LPLPTVTTTTASAGGGDDRGTADPTILPVPTTTVLTIPKTTTGADRPPMDLGPTVKPTTTVAPTT
jgi:hypothetical protein